MSHLDYDGSSAKFSTNSHEMDYSVADLVVGPDLQLTVDAQHQQAQHDHVTW